MANRFLVTGGAGYAGSHLVLALLDRGDAVVVLDNLSTGHRAAVPEGATLIAGDAGDAATLDRVLGGARFDAVFHFASLSLVGESMQFPFRYFQENTAKAVTLIDACVRHGVDKFVLSSTAALFGEPEAIPIPEDARILPASPYGASKLMIEKVLLWAEKIHGMRSACLRYFNAAGCDPAGRAGEDHTPETHLIPLVIDAALGRRPPLTVFGGDYPTPDGTCIRDYVHVTDLAEAHLLAFARLAEGSVTWNLGNGQGHSVLEVVRTAERVMGRAVPFSMSARRPGDPAALVASSDRIKREAGWAPAHAGLHHIIETAYRWRLAHPHGWRAG